MNKNISWISVNKYLQGDSSDLIEVFFEGMTADSWRKLFDWLSNRVIVLDCHFGRLPPDELSIDLFLDGSMCYVAYIRGIEECKLSLLIMEENELSISIQIQEITDESRFGAFLDSISLIADVTGCKKYIICHDLQRDAPFIVNGKLV